jgi:hypothetical protein
VPKLKLKPCSPNAERDGRIEREVLRGKAQDAKVQLLSWRNYIARASEFPFSAKLESRALGVGGLFSVIGLAAAKPGEVQLYAKVIDGQGSNAVPLFEPMPLSPESPTVQAVLDWHYWVERGHAFEGLQ